jgi:hypothetical protein
VAGFLSGFFGGKSKDETPAQPEAKQPKTNGQAYYLEMDEARTYGDLNYMRTSKKIRRTFPKTVNNEEIEMEKEVSAMNMADAGLGSQVPKVSMGSIVTGTPQSPSTTANGSTPTNADAIERRKSDSSLDMFRNMAKDIRK